MTQLPDSQQLFGALANLVKEIAGEDTVSTFVEKVKHYQLDFTLSSLLPADYFPTPQTYLQDQLKDENKGVYKELKKRSFLKKEQLQYLIDEPLDITNLYPYVAISEKQQIHASIESSRYNVPGLSPKVYSVPELTVIEKNKDGSSKRITNFDFYFTVNQAFPLDQCLAKAKEMGHVLTLGPRSSQGLNLYELQSIEEQPLEKMTKQTPFFLSLGRLLPEKINFKKSHLKLFTSERRPFQNYGDRKQQEKKLGTQFISFIESGSLIYLEPNIPCYLAGKSVESPFDPSKKSIVFGQSVLYPLTIKEGKHG